MEIQIIIRCLVRSIIENNQLKLPIIKASLIESLDELHFSIAMFNINSKKIILIVALVLNDNNKIK